MRPGELNQEMELRYRFPGLQGRLRWVQLSILCDEDEDEEGKHFNTYQRNRICLWGQKPPLKKGFNRQTLNCNV